MHFKIGEIDLGHAVALAVETDHALFMERDDSDDVEVHRRAEGAAVLVVGMVAADLGATGSGIDMDVFMVGIDLRKALDRLDVAMALCV